MNTLTLFMGICCIASIAILVATIAKEKIVKKNKKSSNYSF